MSSAPIFSRARSTTGQVATSGTDVGPEGIQILKRQHWGVTVLLLTLAFSFVGYRINGGRPSLPWMTGGLVAGVFVTVALARVGKR
jgi:hypothetical protein